LALVPYRQRTVVGDRSGVTDAHVECERHECRGDQQCDAGAEPD
jgi:hypothetical protein